MPQQLRLALASTNVIESAFAIVERVCFNLKRWHGGDQRERRAGSGMIVAEKKSRGIKGYKKLPALLRVLETLKPPRKAVATQRKAS